MPCLQKFFLADSLISVFKWSFLPRFALSMASRWATGIKNSPFITESGALQRIPFFSRFLPGNVLFSLPWVNLRRLGRRRHLIHPKGEVSSRGWLDRPLGLEGAMVFFSKKRGPDHHFQVCLWWNWMIFLGCVTIQFENLKSEFFFCKNMPQQA